MTVFVLCPGLRSQTCIIIFLGVIDLPIIHSVFYSVGLAEVNYAGSFNNKLAIRRTWPFSVILGGILGFCSHGEETWPSGNAELEYTSASIDKGSPPLPLLPHRLFPVGRPEASTGNTWTTG